MNNISEIHINKKNLINNVLEFRKKILENKKNSQIKIAGVVKANAYGHGTKEVVSILEKYVDYFQVDDFAELQEIRQYTQKPTFVFGYVAKNQLSDAIKLNGIFGVYDLGIIKKINQISKSQNKKTKIHIKIDCFLGRQGILSSQAREFFIAIKKFEFLEVEAVYSHFSNIEDVDNLEHAQKQYHDLLKTKQIAKDCGFYNIFHHISATSGFLTDQKENWGGEIVRLGIGMYGLWPSVFLKKRFEKYINIKPVMSWITQIAQIKDLPKNYPIGYGKTFITNKKTKIAIIPQGYSDGYDRGFSNNGHVLIAGKKCKILGRVAMNMFVVDISFDISKNILKVGDIVVLLGVQNNQEITAEFLAENINTINYEFVTRIWPKLPRKII
ncbi:MAG TPA: alanine racemase [Candidatus Paceibacterota bacterium]|nr:alanine racemase [Candidatus Paceibacterota bacterium]HMP19238.1 alanine racemase [Candidatus Paceibacterota bacterium]HMP85390.1 alanine racemase [Candidatus Paceibacterota bacterium]